MMQKPTCDRPLRGLAMRKSAGISMVALLWAAQVLLACMTATAAGSVRNAQVPLVHDQPDRQQQAQQDKLVSQERSRRTVEQKNVVKYRLWPASKIKETLDDWAAKYPDFVHLTSSQEKYGLPRAGNIHDCPFDDAADGCANYILTIQDFTKHPDGSSSSNHLPEVFWSGCLHGNERVGPTATMEAATLLLEAAACEAMPRREKLLDADQRDDEMLLAQQCRSDLADKGIDEAHRKWLARLVSTRRLIVVPTSNALGYFRNRREEGDIDPNRDFPYDLKDPKLCMQTVTGRTLNEIFREHMFQLALTFHGGMEVIAYEWGAPSWLKHLSPDDTAQNQVAESYSKVAGKFQSTKPYAYGTMNDLVYYVRGGMEDWAYAGSFDKARVPQCKPTTFGGYPEEKTKYNNSTLRVFNMLIETSNKKQPTTKSLGSSLDVMNSKSPGNGHVSRNIRLALLSADLVEPYVAPIQLNDVPLSNDIIPLDTFSVFENANQDSATAGAETVSAEEEACRFTRGFLVTPDTETVDIQFTVGGALTIDQVEVWYAKWCEIPRDQLNCNSQPKNLDGFTKGTIIGASNGGGAFSKDGAWPQMDGDNYKGDSFFGPVFTASIDLSEFEDQDEIVVIAGAMVDQDWATTPRTAKPDILPQSHVVNARTNPEWHHESAGKHIVGRLMWYSLPLTITLDESIQANETEKATVIEMNTRDANTTTALGGTGAFGQCPASQAESRNVVPLVLFVFIVSLICIACSLGHDGVHTLSSASNRSKMNRAFADTDDFVFDSRPYSDYNETQASESEDEIEISGLS